MKIKLSSTSFLLPNNKSWEFLEKNKNINFGEYGDFISDIPNFKTIAGTPNFPSYTSGHSVFSAAGAEVLSYVFPQDAQKFREWALEAAISRVYGGIHWTFDAEVGTTQGIQVASYTIQAAQNDGAN